MKIEELCNYLRFNLDNYINGDIKVTSCWNIKKDGLAHIKNKIGE
jgi:hypothetical protein